MIPEVGLSVDHHLQTSSPRSKYQLSESNGGDSNLVRLLWNTTNSVPDEMAFNTRDNKMTCPTSPYHFLC